MLEILKERLQAAISKLRRKAHLDEETIREFLRDIERALLLSDVRVEDVFQITQKIKSRILREEVPPGITKREYLLKVVYEELVRLMGEKKAELIINPQKQTKIMLVGLQGSGKTTTVAKLAAYLRRKGFSVATICTDTYRRGAQDQLRRLSAEAEVEFLEINSGSKEIKEIVKLIEKKLADKQVLIFDTAGRHKEEKALLEEMKELAEAINPDYIFLVIDATVGQQAYNQAKAFHQYVPVGGIIVTKLDGSARGGGALSATAATGAKIFFLGTGEKINDFEEYDPSRFVSRLLGMGDLQTLLEKVKALEVAEERVKRIASGKFTLIDFIEQIEEVRKLGSFKKILDLLPISLPKIPIEKIDEIDKKLTRWKVALNSMTLEEKLNPDIISSSRIRRISKGAGLDEKEIKEMLKQYRILKKMLRSGKGRRLMKMLRKRGFEGAI